MNFGLKKSSADHSYFFKHENGIYLGIIIYVDAILIACNNDSLVNQFKTYLGQHFQYKDLGPPQYFLGLEIQRSDDGIYVCQRKYILDLQKDTGLTGCKPNFTPMESNKHLPLCEDDHLPNAKVYMRLVGRLLYLGFTRPDISFSVNKLSQFYSQPCSHHMAAAHRILRYLKRTAGLGLYYS